MDKKHKIIAVLGPTGIGKSALALQIALKFDALILSSDAFMVYKDLNIGTNKPKADEINQVEHYYGLDLVEINQKFSIYDYQQYARNLIDHATKPVVIVGGSMLYLDSVLYNYTLPKNFDNSNRYEQINTVQLYAELKQLDPLSAQKIEANNRKRIMTALNFFKQFHYSIQQNNQKHELMYDTFFIYLKPLDKEKLKFKNQKRVDQMLQEGWIQEVKNLINKYPDFNQTNAFLAIGYKDVYVAIINNKEVDKAHIIQKTNKFIKHQLTWYKRYEHQCLILHEEYDIQEVFMQINRFLND